MVTLSVEYWKKQHGIDMGFVDDDGKPTSPTVKLHLGEFLTHLGVDKEDCGTAIDEVHSMADVDDPVDIRDRKQLECLPTDFTEKTVLDIGGYNGYVAKYCLDHGAKRAIVVDNQQYSGYTLPGYPYGWGSPTMIDGVEYAKGDLMDFSTWMDLASLGQVVFFFNVIYHISNPLEALCRLRLLTKEVLYLSTSVQDGGAEGSWIFIPDDSRRIFFSPTCSGLERMLVYVGFTPELLSRYDNMAIYKCV